MPRFSEVELWKQVWTGGQALLSPSEASGLGLGIPARRPPQSSREVSVRGLWGRNRAEEEEEGNGKQSTESGLKFTVFGRKQQLSTGRLGAVEAQSGFLPSGAGASSCGDKTEELTELTIFPSLLGGIRGRVPAHLSVEGSGGSGSWVGERSR